MSASKPFLVYSDGYLKYDFGPLHPLKPQRLSLFHQIASSHGLLGRFSAVEPKPATDKQILAVHTAEYVNAIKKQEPGHGLGSADNPFFNDMFGSSALIAGGSIEAARLSLSGSVPAFNPGGGWHHALPDRASGFCILNDIAIAIRSLPPGTRVLYIDIDAHHGDGVERIFREDNNVFTVSFHEDGRFLFPGTGTEEEQGPTFMNFPMLPGAGDSCFTTAFDALIPSTFHAFRPDVIMMQCGVDAHHTDRLAHLRLTYRSYEHAFSEALKLSRSCNNHLVLLGGGGYNEKAVAEVWAMALGVLSGVKTGFEDTAVHENEIAVSQASRLLERLQKGL